LKSVKRMEIPCRAFGSATSMAAAQNQVLLPLSRLSMKRHGLPFAGGQLCEPLPTVPGKIEALRFARLERV